VRQEAPLARVLVPSNIGEPEQVLAALGAGAQGYLLKDAVLTNVVVAIHALHHGHMSFDRSVDQLASMAIQELGAAVTSGALPAMICVICRRYLRLLTDVAGWSAIYNLLSFQLMCRREGIS
jgi:DNA-binding NarL/FixJ family response regulator